jgi:hypothetical protein
MTDHAGNRDLPETIDQVLGLLDSEPAGLAVANADAGALGAPCLVAAMDQFAARDADTRRQLAALLHALRDLAMHDARRAGAEGNQDG